MLVVVMFPFLSSFLRADGQIFIIILVSKMILRADKLVFDFNDKWSFVLSVTHTE